MLRATVIGEMKGSEHKREVSKKAGQEFYAHGEWELHRHPCWRYTLILQRGGLQQLTGVEEVSGARFPPPLG